MESATAMPKDELKILMKAAIIEVLTERKEWFAEIFHEVIEDYYLGLAIDEGLKGDYVSREEVFATLNED